MAYSTTFHSDDNNNVKAPTPKTQKSYTELVRAKKLNKPVRGGVRV